MFHGYFDESGNFEQSDGVFCISGYFITADSAQAMDREWRAVLNSHDIPYFHMVDCAHGTGVFASKPKEERVEIVRELIDLIKKHTIEGFAVLAHVGAFDVSQEDDPDAYSHCARMAVEALKMFLKIGRIEDGMVCFFESGHHSAGRAYNQIAARLPDLSASVTFGSKEQIPLLQAADLLAWQATKYAKDRRTNARQPRRDFLSLMEHPHSFAYLYIKDGHKSMGVEVWPLDRRSQQTTGLTVDRKSPVVFMKEDGDDVPIIPVSQTHGWRGGGGRMTYVAFTDLADNKFYLSFDDARLDEAMNCLIAAMSDLAGGYWFSACPSLTFP
jgi:hypothetical protein